MYLYFIGFRLYFEWNHYILCCCDVVMLCSFVSYIICALVFCPRVRAPWLVRRLRPGVTPPIRTAVHLFLYLSSRGRVLSIYITWLQLYNYWSLSVCLSVRPSGEFMPHGQNFYLSTLLAIVRILVCGTGAGAWRRQRGGASVEAPALTTPIPDITLQEASLCIRCWTAMDISHHVHGAVV